MPTALEQQIVDTARAELIPNSMLQSDGKTVIDVRLEGTKPDTKLIVTVADSRTSMTPQWAASYSLCDGTWMQTGNRDPTPGAVATCVFSDLLDS